MLLKEKNLYNAYMKEYMRTRYRERMQRAVGFLGKKCVRCGSEDSLEFDHILPSSKFKNVSRMWSYSNVRFWEEINKCQLLCRACHEKKSLIDLNFNDSKNSHGTLSTYKTYKCRCILCKKANSIYSKEYKRKRKQQLMGL